MSDGWVICKGCSLKFRSRERTCPRCERPMDEDQLQFGSHFSPEDAPTDQSALKIAIPVAVVLTLLGAFAFMGPLGGRGVGVVSIALVLLGLGVVSVGWAWSMVLAFRIGLGSFVFALLVPFVSTLVMGKWPALVWKVMGTAMVVLGVLFAPPGFTSKARIHEVATACEAQGALDAVACACVGGQTVSLMTPEERSGPFDPQNAKTRDLMTTAATICRKQRLTAACVTAKQGSDTLCTCVINAAVDTMTPTELDNAIDAVSNGLHPEGYMALKADCLKRGN